MLVTPSLISLQFSRVLLSPSTCSHFQMPLSNSCQALRAARTEWKCRSAHGWVHTGTIVASVSFLQFHLLLQLVQVPYSLSWHGWRLRLAFIVRPWE